MHIEYNHTIYIYIYFIILLYYITIHIVKILFLYVNIISKKILELLYYLNK